MMLHFMETDARGDWSLDGRSPPPPSRPGESVRITSLLQTAAPLAFSTLLVGPDPRNRCLDPGGRGVVQLSTPGTWRVDEVTIDDVANEDVVRALEAEFLRVADGCLVVVSGGFGVGSRCSITATNVGDTAAYFYATWELEDVQ